MVHTVVLMRNRTIQIQMQSVAMQRISSHIIAKQFYNRIKVIITENARANLNLFRAVDTAIALLPPPHVTVFFFSNFSNIFLLSFGSLKKLLSTLVSVLCVCVQVECAGVHASIEAYGLVYECVDYFINDVITREMLICCIKH